MNPVVVNCVPLYVFVVVLSLLQSRFKIYKHDPTTFLILLVICPILAFLKVAGKAKTYMAITGFEIFFWTLMMAFMHPRSIVPRINEGYILAYTLLHWYLLMTSVDETGWNTILTLVAVLSVYPTLLVIKCAFQHKRVDRVSKIVLYYWFLFAIIFTYIDQIAMDIIEPIMALPDVSLSSLFYIVVTGVQLYFISTIFSLLIVGIPIFHMDRTFESVKVRWTRAKKECGETLQHKLDNYIEYQLSSHEAILIILTSVLFFLFDYSFDFRFYLILFYTVGLPIIFFYLKRAPMENLEE